MAGEDDNGKPIIEFGIRMGAGIGLWRWLSGEVEGLDGGGGKVPGKNYFG